MENEQLKYHEKRVYVAKQFTFDSAHFLHCYVGKCANMHGHTYKLEVIVSGKPDYRGIVLDFTVLKKIVKELIVEKLDHKILNEILTQMNTTAENMVVWIFEELENYLKEHNKEIRVEKVVLWETPTSYAAITRELMLANE